MERTTVESSNLNSIGYDWPGYVLEVEFRDGTVYRYDRVPPHVYLGLMNATSKGKYFHQYVLDRYPTTRISGPGAPGSA